jgi:rhodanese-related sulfurtransferase
MDTGQLVLYGMLAAILGFHLWRRFEARSIPRYGAFDVAEKVKNGGGVLVDVRTAGERSLTSIPGSLHIPMSQLSTRMSELERHQGKEVIFYCATGSRSIVAAVRARKAGIQSAHLEGGIATWNLS